MLMTSHYLLTTNLLLLLLVLILTYMLTTIMFLFILKKGFGIGPGCDIILEPFSGKSQVCCSSMRRQSVQPTGERTGAWIYYSS